MSAPATVRPADPVRDLASSIFVELVCRNVVVTDSEGRWRLPIAVDVELKAPTQPKNQEFDMKAASLPGWVEKKI